MEQRIIDVRHEGRIRYAPALDLQMDLHAKRVAGTIPDTILLLEHDPVFTLGRQGRRDSLLVSEDELLRRGIDLHHIDRGGDITYHGPGQVVAYFIVDISQRNKDIKRLIHALEEAMIRTAARYELDAARDEHYPGVWVDDGKIGAVGLRIDQGVTRHGIAFNVNTNLDDFRLINPCGIIDKSVTSLQKELGRDVSMDTVTDALGKHLVELLGTW